MDFGDVWPRRLSRRCAAAGLMVLVAAPAVAQTYKNYCPPAPCPMPSYYAPGVTTPAWPPQPPAAPGTAAPAPMPAVPGADAAAAPTVSVAPESSGLALSGSTVAMAATPFMMGDLG